MIHGVYTSEKKRLKFLVAGSFKYPFYDEACATALEELGYDVERFSWQRYFDSRLFSRFQQRFLIGPAIRSINSQFLAVIRAVQPQVVFVTRGVPIWPRTLHAAKIAAPSFLISYNNDDPFGPTSDRLLWRYVISGIPYYDFHFVYRRINIDEYQRHGAKRIKILMPYYMPDIHYCMPLSSHDLAQYLCDFVFIGHAESDSRVQHLRALSEAGCNLRIYGAGWDRLVTQEPWLTKHLFPTVWGKDYTKAIRAAKVALVFFSKRNRDTYTRRSFEIPAIGTCMLSERTDDMQCMYRENVEAVYFSNETELIEKARWLIKNGIVRERIAQSANRRVRVLGGSVTERMSYMATSIMEYLKYEDFAD